MEATDQGAATNSHIIENPVVEIGDQFTSCVYPLVQQSPAADTSFHSPMEGRIDVVREFEYGLDAPFVEIL